MAAIEVAQVVVGVAILGAVILPRIVSDKPLSFPIVYVVGGIVLFSIPIGTPTVDPVEQGEIAERLAEFVVIIALMGAGLKLDRPFSVRAWASTWRLLGIAMPITILLTTLLGLWIFGTLTATAILFGAVVAPTDPVLASDVQATPPEEEIDEETKSLRQEDDVRFGLTSEAGLNDGLAFPFTHLAIAAAATGTLASGGWLVDWFAVYVVQEIAIGAVVGYVAGRLLAWILFANPSVTQYSKVMEGAEALAATLLVYGVTELLHGYGFIAVFVAALALRNYEWEHDYYLELHDFAIVVERLTMAAVLVLFGGAIANGLLAPLTPIDVAVGLVVVLVVRPLAGVISMLGSSLTWPERLVISFFGIRGVGSFFYLAFALNEASFAERELLYTADKLWALVGFVVLASIVIHGITAGPVMDELDRRNGRESSTGH